MVDCPLIPLMVDKREAPFNLRHVDQVGHKREVANIENLPCPMVGRIWKCFTGVPVELYG